MNELTVINGMFNSDEGYHITKEAIKSELDNTKDFTGSFLLELLYDISPYEYIDYMINNHNRVNLIPKHDYPKIFNKIQPFPCIDKAYSIFIHNRTDYDEELLLKLLPTNGLNYILVRHAFLKRIRIPSIERMEYNLQIEDYMEYCTRIYPVPKLLEHIRDTSVEDYYLISQEKPTREDAIKILSSSNLVDFIIKKDLNHKTAIEYFSNKNPNYVKHKITKEFIEYLYLKEFSHDAFNCLTMFNCFGTGHRNLKFRLIIDRLDYLHISIYDITYNITIYRNTYISKSNIESSHFVEKSLHDYKCSTVNKVYTYIRERNYYLVDQEERYYA